jgi:membrane protease YdiL (CAAX protease family)
VQATLPIYGIIILWIIACCLWPMVRGLSFSQIRAGLGWSTGRGVLVEAAMGLVGYITFMPLLALAVVLSIILSKFGHEHAIHPIVFEAEDKSRGAIIGLYLLASGFAPIVEETMFRGAFFHHLRAYHRWLLSAFVSALVFAALHPQGWTAFPVLGGIGFAFAGIREWRGNVIASGFAHAVNNAVATTMLLLVLS